MEDNSGLNSAFVVDGWTVKCEVPSDDESDSKEEFAAQNADEAFGVNNVLCRNVQLDVRVKNEPNDNGKMDDMNPAVLTSIDENVLENNWSADSIVQVKTDPEGVQKESLAPASHDENLLRTSWETRKTPDSDSELSERGTEIMVNSASFPFLRTEPAVTSEELTRLETPMSVSEALSSLDDAQLIVETGQQQRRTIKQLLRERREAPDSESSKKKAKMSSKTLHGYWCDECNVLFKSSLALEYHKANTTHVGFPRMQGMKCSYCSLLCGSPDELCDHTNVTCLRCPAKFQCFLAFLLHKKTKHQLRENACEVCSLEFANSPLLISHRKLCAQEHKVTSIVDESTPEEKDEKTERQMNVAIDMGHGEFSVGVEITNDEENSRKIAMDSKFGEGEASDSVSATPEEESRGAVEEPHPLAVECRCRGKKIQRSELECPICDREFETKFRLDLHKMKSNCKDYLMCDLCGFPFKGHRLLNRHIGVFECMRCATEFGCLNAVQRHVRVCHGLRLNECEICYKVFVWLQDHRIQKHGAGNQMWPRNLPQQQINQNEKVKIMRSGLVASLPRILPKTSTDTDTEPRARGSGENCPKITKFGQIFSTGNEPRPFADMGKFGCSSCRQVFPGLRQREYHQVNSVSCSVDKPNCGCCAAQCETVDAYIEHTTPTCLKCKVTFRCARVLDIHKSEEHNLSEKHCEVCAEALSFALQSDLRAHRILAHGAWGNLDGGVTLVVTLPTPT